MFSIFFIAVCFLELLYVCSVSHAKVQSFCGKTIDILVFGTNLPVCGTNCLYKINKINLEMFLSL